MQELAMWVQYLTLRAVNYILGVIVPLRSIVLDKISAVL
jgi:hypothetical protein